MKEFKQIPDVEAIFMLGGIYDNLCNGMMVDSEGDIVTDDIHGLFMSVLSVTILHKARDGITLSQIDLVILDIIVKISNILYNNTSADILPLDDGVYDQIVVLLKRYGIDYQVGAVPVQFNETAPTYKGDEFHLKNYVPDGNKYSDCIYNHIGPGNQKMRRVAFLEEELVPISRRYINQIHNYPELVGTLEKCKYVLNADAGDKINDPAIQIFERDFLHKCLQMGVISPNEEFEMCLELKYDGVSVEADVLGNRIIQALSRGDTANNQATDYTPIFGNYLFPCDGADDRLLNSNFGIKFECIITKSDLAKLSALRGKNYANCRNAISGLLSSSDGNQYINFFTLVPLASSIEGISRKDELDFLNQFYAAEEWNRYIMIRGNYQQILAQVKQFYLAADYTREYLNYLIDGIVVSFTDPKKKAMLGRANSINKWSIAIKFVAKEVRTTVIGFKYSVGKTGKVTPNVLFKPVEFLGNIEWEQSIHTYEKFKKYNLSIGSDIILKYSNEVLTYVDVIDTPRNRELAARNNPIQFPTHCPYCGAPIQFTEKEAFCSNPKCSERLVQRSVAMMSNLGFDGFAESAVRALDLGNNPVKLFKLSFEEVSNVLGEVRANNFMIQLQNITTIPIPDYKLMNALGLAAGIGPKKWAKIFNVVTITEMLTETAKAKEVIISEIGGVTADDAVALLNDSDSFTILWEFSLRMNIVDSKTTINLMSNMPQIVITGSRDQYLIDEINSCGVGICDPDNNVTKNTACVVSVGSKISSKVIKAQKYGIPVMAYEEFIEKFKGIKK